MNYNETKNGIELCVKGLSFDIAETLECGQCFRFERISGDEFTLMAKDRSLTLRREQDKILFLGATLCDFENVWIEYFDLNRDYGHIKEAVSSNDLIMRDAVDFAPGIHILRQDPWECLVSFIISQNNRIPMIKQVVKNLCERFGERKDGIYTFPRPEILAGADESAIMECKAGFRAKYILDAARKASSGEINVYDTERISTSKLREKLMQIKGVGGKIADCVMLFSMGRHEVFPTDVWIKRIMMKLYFDGAQVPDMEIHELARRKFGDYAGFAQQYLYHYARINKVV